MAIPPPRRLSNQSDFDREHYNHLIDTIKWVLGLAGGAISIIVAVALGFTWNDRSEYNEEVKNTLLEAKNDLKDAKTEYINSLKDIKAEARLEMEKLEKQMTDQVPIIRQNAENLAMSTVQERLNEEFESRNIQALINKVAEERLQGKVGQILEGKIRQRTEEIDDQTRALARLSIAIDQIRAGNRKWLDDVDSIKTYHKLSIIRDLANELLQQKIQDYEIGIKYNHVFDKDDTTILVQVPKIYISPYSRDLQVLSVEEGITTIMKEMRDENNLSIVATNFLALKRLTGISFRLFDFTSVFNWYNRIYLKDKDSLKRKVTQQRFVMILGDTNTFLNFKE